MLPPQKATSPNYNSTRVENLNENQLRLMELISKYCSYLFKIVIYLFSFNSRKSSTLAVQLIMMLKSCILLRFIWNKLLQVRIPLKSTTTTLQCVECDYCSFCMATDFNNCTLLYLFNKHFLLGSVTNFSVKYLDLFGKPVAGRTHSYQWGWGLFIRRSSVSKILEKRHNIIGGT